MRILVQKKECEVKTEVNMYRIPLIGCNWTDKPFCLLQKYRLVRTFYRFLYDLLLPGRINSIEVTCTLFPGEVKEHRIFRHFEAMCWRMAL